MPADALEVTDRNLAAETPPVTTDTQPTRTAHGVRVIALLLGALCAVVLLFPVLTSPLNADDRYWYLLIGARAQGSVLEVFAWTWDHVASDLLSGRSASLAALERRLVGLGVIEAAVASGTPIVVYQALVKLALYAGGVLSCLALVRSLRSRDPDGRLVRPSSSTLWLTTLAGMLAIAAGAQAHSSFRNAWTSYPVFTYTAVIFIFGSIALLLWLSRLVAERSKGMAVTAVIVLLVLAVATNFSYELVYPAVPVAAVALALVPVTDTSRRAAGRRAKLITSAAYLGGFTVVFAAIRLYLADVCATGDCYTGVQMQLGPGVIRTAAINLVTAVPGFGDTELQTELDAVGWAERYPVLPGSWSIAVGIAVVVVLLMMWWATSRHRAAGLVDTTDFTLIPDPRSEARLLFVGAGLCLLTALGTAAIMSLSVQAQDVITAPGHPYRNTLVTWTALAFGAVLLVRAGTLVLPRRAGLVAWTSFALVIGTVAALTLPGNLMALRASRITLAPTEAVNWEVVQGDLRPGADARRCDLFERLEGERIADRARVAIYKNATNAFEHYHGQPFCSDPSYAGTE